MKQKVFWILFYIIPVVIFTLLSIFIDPVYFQNSVNISSVRQKQNITCKTTQAIKQFFNYS